MQKYRRHLKTMCNMAARYPHERSKLSSLLGAPLVPQCSAGCSTPFLTRALEWGTELRAMEGGGGIICPTPCQLSSYEGWNRQIFMEGGLVKGL